MEATIEIKDYERDDIQHESYRTFFGGVKSRQVNRGKKKFYALNLYLMPSEEERAIILKYKLDELAIETDNKFTEEYLADSEEQMRALTPGVSEEIFKPGIGAGIDDLRKMKTQTLLNHYFDNPYTKHFDTRQDAHTYADKLEKEILPLIKSQIDYYRLESVRRDKRTITL
jgi:hypothetical protein